MPFDVVSGDGFRNLLKTFDKNYNMPHRKTVTRKSDSRFISVAEYLKNKISCAKWVSITSDIWTEQYNTKSYLSLTVHFINNKRMESVTVALKPLNSSHTADNIKNNVKEILNEWNLSGEKIVCAITDGGPNIVKAFQELFGKSKHLHCCAHRLHLMITESLRHTEEIIGLINTVKIIVTFFHQSVRATDKLREMQSKDDKIPLKLFNDVNTRWNSTLHMLNRFIELHRYIITILSEITGPDLPSKQKFNRITII